MYFHNNPSIFRYRGFNVSTRFSDRINMLGISGQGIEGRYSVCTLLDEMPQEAVKNSRRIRAELDRIIFSGECD